MCMYAFFLRDHALTKRESSLYNRIECSSVRDVSVSTDRDLLSLDNITALRDADQMPPYPLSDIVSTMSDNVWCANPTAGNYVNMTFNQPVVVEGIISGGAFTRSRTREHYVSNFSILFSRDVNGQLQLYDRVYTGLIIQ